MVDIRKNNKEFWFNTTMQGNTFNRWPFSGRQGYETDLAGSIVADDYGTGFENAKKTGTMQNVLTNSINIGRKNFITPQMKPAFNLISNGYTSNRILGKEWDKQINERTGQQLERLGRLSSEAAATDRTWRNLGSAEKFTSVSDFMKVLTAQRLCEDENLMSNLKTKDELKEMGYTLGNLAVPVTTEHGIDYYDISMAKDNNLPANKSPAITAFKKEGKVEKISLDSVKLDQSANFDAFLQRVSQATGVRFVPNVELPTGTVNIKVSRIRTAGRQVVNYFRAKFNRQQNVMPARVQMQYSTNGRPEEQIYAIIKEIARMSINPYINRVKRIISHGDGYNLPSSAEFISNESTLKEFSADLIASEMAGMFMDSKQDGKILREMFKLDAAQTLSTLKEDNTWMIPLASGFFATSVNRCASNLNYTASQYIETNNLENTNVRNFLGALFAKENYKNSWGLYTSTFKVENPPYMIAESDPEPNYDDRAFRQFMQMPLQENETTPPTQRVESDPMPEYDDEAFRNFMELEPEIPHGPTGRAASDPMPEYDDRAFRAFNNLPLQTTENAMPYTVASSDPDPNYDYRAFRQFNNLPLQENETTPPTQVAERQPMPEYNDRAFRAFNNLPPQEVQEETPYMVAQSDEMPNYNDRAFRQFNNLPLQEARTGVRTPSDPMPEYDDEAFRNFMELEPEIPHGPTGRAASDPMPEYDDRAFRAFNKLPLQNVKNKEDVPYMFAKTDDMPNYDGRAFRAFRNLPLQEVRTGIRTPSDPDPNYDYRAFRQFNNLPLQENETTPPTQVAESQPMPEYNDRAFRQWLNLKLGEHDNVEPYSWAYSDKMPEYDDRAFREFQKLPPLEKECYESISAEENNGINNSLSEEAVKINNAKISKYRNWALLSKYGLSDITNDIIRHNLEDLPFPQGKEEEYILKTQETMLKNYEEVYSYVWGIVGEVIEDKFLTLKDAVNKNASEIEELKKKYDGTSDEYKVRTAEFKQEKLCAELKDFATLKGRVGNPKIGNTVVAPSEKVYDLEKDAKKGDKYAKLALKVHEIIGRTSNSVVDIAASTKGIIDAKEFKNTARLTGKKLAQKIIATEYGTLGKKTGAQRFRRDVYEEVQQIFESRKFCTNEDDLSL